MIFTIEAQKRTNTKHSELTALRQQGFIPAVIYGKALESTPIAVKKNEFLKCYKKSFQELSFYEIILDGQKYHTILKDKQIHPVTREMLHLDFMVVSAGAIIEVEVPIIITGEPIGVKEGGMMEIVQRNVKISCKANEIPDELTLDVSNLKIGESLHIRDLPQGNWQVKEHSDVTLVAIHAPRAEVVEEKPAAPAPEEQTTPETEK